MILKKATPLLEHPLATFKLCLALFIGYLFLIFMPTTKNQWILITIVIIMNSSHTTGLQTEKALHRILGTFGGMALGCLSLLAPSNHAISITLLLFTALLFSWYGQRFPKYHYVSTLGIITYCIITMSAHPSLFLASLRGMDIIAGILISLLVSRYVFPLKSNIVAQQTIDQLKLTIKEFNDNVFILKIPRRNNAKFVELDNKIAALLSKTRTIIDSMHFDTPNPDKKNSLATLRYLRACYHYLMFIETAIHELQLLNNPHFGEFQTAIIPFSHTVSNLLSVSSTPDKQTYNTLNQDIHNFEISTQSISNTLTEQHGQHAIIFAMKRIHFCLTSSIS